MDSDSHRRKTDRRWRIYIADYLTQDVHAQIPESGNLFDG